jgi:hypothetical protein
VATLAELQADVITITNRPDLVAETLLAVKKATLKMHQLDFFYKDLKETGIQFDPADYTQQIEYRTLLTRYRALKYLRKATDSSTPSDFLTVIHPAEVIDKYAVQREDVCYVAGEIIQIKSSTSLEYVLIGYYQHPDISTDNYSSWIALDHPYAIVAEAAASIFKMIGWDEQATFWKEEVKENIAILRSNNIEAEGV